MTTLHPTLAIKLKADKERYVKVTKFAELLPLFAKDIISKELTQDTYSVLSYQYKKLSCAWGINWFVNKPMNYPENKNKPIGLICVYINCCSLFNEACYDFARQELGRTLPLITVHFYDALNSTFYFLPSELEDGLDKLENWYNNTKDQSSVYLKQKRKDELKKELESLSN